LVKQSEALNLAENEANDKGEGFFANFADFLCVLGGKKLLTAKAAN
jgi:hypothetical protein